MGVILYICQNQEGCCSQGAAEIELHIEDPEFSSPGDLGGPPYPDRQKEVAEAAALRLEPCRSFGGPQRELKIPCHVPAGEATSRSSLKLKLEPSIIFASLIHVFLHTLTNIYKPALITNRQCGCGQIGDDERDSNEQPARLGAVEIALTMATLQDRCPRSCHSPGSRRGQCRCRTTGQKQLVRILPSIRRLCHIWQFFSKQGGRFQPLQLNPGYTHHRHLGMAVPMDEVAGFRSQSKSGSMDCRTQINPCLGDDTRSRFTLCL